MQAKNHSTLLTKVALVTLPLLLLTLVYVSCDPFKVLYRYKFANYYDWQPFELNRENASFQNLQLRLLQRDTPTAYIMGNSRSLAFHCRQWEKYLPLGSKAYHFDAASESLFGLYTKVKYLHEHNLPFSHLLFVIDVSIFRYLKNQDDYTHIKHPELTGESAWKYQLTFFKSFFSNLFCIKYIHYKISGKVYHYMEDIFVIKPGYFGNEAYQNDYLYTGYEKILKRDSLYYYHTFKAKDFASRRVGRPSQANIGEAELQMLKAIRKIIEEHNIQLKIVISPLYDQVAMASTDVAALKNLFGEAAVYDFSGQNNITTFVGNYYETSHYKPSVANTLLDTMYKTTIAKP